MKRELGIARCGLACCLCSENVVCKGCKRDGFKELSASLRTAAKVFMQRRSSRVRLPNLHAGTVWKNSWTALNAMRKPASYITVKALWAIMMISTTSRN